MKIYKIVTIIIIAAAIALVWWLSGNYIFHDQTSWYEALTFGLLFSIASHFLTPRLDMYFKKSNDKKKP